MTNEQIERLYAFIMFNHDLISQEHLTTLLATDLSKKPTDN